MKRDTPALTLRPGASAFAQEHLRITRHAVRRNIAIPDRGAEADALVGSWRPSAVALARESWHARMVHEHESAAVFAGLLPLFMEAGFPLEFKTAVTRMAIDELFHAELCGRVVEALGGVAESADPVALEPLPLHQGCSAVEAALRNTVFASCLSETVSMALLTAERERCEEPFIGEVLKQLQSDEVSHARLGWSVVEHVIPELSTAEVERTNAYLPVAFAHLERCMHAAMPLSTVPAPVLDHAERLGATDSRKARALYAQTVDEVIRPRLRAAGLDA